MTGQEIIPLGAIRTIIDEDQKMGVIVGFYDSHNQHGIQAHAVDARDGETMASHFCSGEGWAKSDLGFSIQGIPLGGSDENNEQRNQVYSHKYPNGYVMFWIGSAFANDFNMEMLKKRDEFNIRLELLKLIDEVRNHNGTLHEVANDLIKKFKVFPDGNRHTHNYEQRNKLGSYANFDLGEKYPPVTP